MKKIIAFLVLVSFFVTNIGQSATYAQSFHLPAAGGMVHLSSPFDPIILQGIKVHPEDPLRFDFIVDKGDSSLGNDQFKGESGKLIRYFLASLTTPEKDLWVNLSPYEKDRVIPDSFGLTEMGRDLLAEDYILKQITASLIYPEGAIGKEFWKRVYEEAARKFGRTDIPLDTFNKVWIVPQKAVVYENVKAGIAYVVDARLNVMLEQDYLSLQQHATTRPEQGTAEEANQLGSQIVREVVIPELTQEINRNSNFARLRQVYNSLILATWYKKKIKNSILSRIYVDKDKTAGVQYASTVLPPATGVRAKDDVEGIYQEYVKAFQKGVYNYIKESEDPVTGQIVPRKYFSGGFGATDLSQVTFETTQDPTALQWGKKSLWDVSVQLAGAKGPRDASMLPKPLGLEHVRQLLDAYIADHRSRDLFRDLKGMGIEPNQFKDVLHAQFQAIYQDYPHGAVNPVQLIKDDPRLKDFLVRLFTQRKVRAGMDPDVMNKVFDKLIEYGRDPELARHKVYEEVIDFERDPDWLKFRGKKDVSDHGLAQILPYIQDINLSSGATVVNVGANNSGLGAMIAEKYPSINIVDSDIESARTVGWENPAGLANLSFHHQPGPMQTGFDDKSVDVIILSSMLHHVTVQAFDGFIKELRRILKPGGRIILREDSFSYSEQVAATDGLNEALTREFLSHDEQFIINAFIFIDWFANTVMNKRIMPMPFDFQSQETWQKVFAHYGFSEESATTYGMPYMRSMQEFRLTSNATPHVPLAIRVDPNTRFNLLLSLLYTDVQEKSMQISYGIRDVERAGWVFNKVFHPETVADHSWGTTVLALLLAPSTLDVKRVIAMAIIHDIAEGPMKKDYRPGEIDEKLKHAMEEDVFSKVTQPFSQRDEWDSMFKELNLAITPEARFLKVVDRFDMWLQARSYQKVYGDRIDFQSFLNNARAMFEKQGDIGKHILDIVDHPSEYKDLLDALDKIYELKRSAEMGKESPTSEAWTKSWTYLSTTSVENDILPGVGLLTLAPILVRSDLKEPLNVLLKSSDNHKLLQNIVETAGDGQNHGLVDDITQIVNRISNDRVKEPVAQDTANLLKTDKDILHLLLLAAQNRPKEYPLARVAAGFVAGNDRLSDEIGVNHYGSHEHAEINLILSILEKEAVNVRAKRQGKFEKLLIQMRKFVKKEKLDTKKGLFLLRKALKMAGQPFKDGTFYVTLMPCSSCQKVLKELGLKRIIYSEIHPDAQVAEKWQRQSEKLSKKNGIQFIHVDMLAAEVQPNRLFDSIVARSPEGHSRFQKEYLRAIDQSTGDDAVALIEKWLSVHKSRLVDIIAFFGNVMPDDAPVLFDILFGRVVDVEKLKDVLQRYGDTEGLASYLSAVHRIAHSTDVDEVINTASIRVMERSSDKAMPTTNGGIDLNADKMNLEVQHDGEEIQFHLDPGMAEQLQKVSGFVPVIFNIQPMTDLKMFLGLKDEGSRQMIVAAAAMTFHMTT